MDYLEGGELFQYVLDRKKLSEDEARVFFKQIMSGIDYCHKEKLIHRDLKLENLLLESKNSTVIKVPNFDNSIFYSNINLNFKFKEEKIYIIEYINNYITTKTKIIDFGISGINN